MKNTWIGIAEGFGTPNGRGDARLWVRQAAAPPTETSQLQPPQVAAKLTIALFSNERRTLMVAIAVVIAVVIAMMATILVL